MLTNIGAITMATMSSPRGWGVDSLVACSSASTQLLTYKSDIKMGFSIEISRNHKILWHPTEALLVKPRQTPSDQSNTWSTHASEIKNLKQKSELKQLLLNNSLPNIKSCIENSDWTRGGQQINCYQIKNGHRLVTEIEKINWMQTFDGRAELGLLHQCPPWSRHNSLWDENREGSPRQSCCSRSKLDAIQNWWTAQCLLDCKARSWSVSGRSKTSTTVLIHSIRQFSVEPKSAIRHRQSQSTGSHRGSLKHFD